MESVEKMAQLSVAYYRALKKTDADALEQAILMAMLLNAATPEPYLAAVEQTGTT